MIRVETGSVLSMDSDTKRVMSLQPGVMRATNSLSIRTLHEVVGYERLSQ